MTPSIQAPHTNLLLAGLPPSLQRRFVASCDLVNLDISQVLSEAGARVKHVFFPLDSFISLITALNENEKLEVGIIGDEGMLGTSLILGVATSSQHALVQGAGKALRMRAADFNRYCKQNGVLREALGRYLHVVMSQLAQTAACARYHVVEARLARWLLLTRDRAHADRFHITHEFLAYMLGVRRVGITQAAGALHARGLITYRRGELRILDSAGLEDASCRCYEQSRVMYEQQLGRRRGTDLR